MRFLSLVGLFFFCSCFPMDAAYSAAKQGSLDMRLMPPDQPLHLSGEWMFFWNEALEPKDFLKRIADPGFEPKIVEIGKRFSELADESVPDDLGYATYVLRLTHIEPESLRDIWIAGGQLYTSAKVYLFSEDGSGAETQTYEVGRFGKSAEESQPRLVDSQATYVPLKSKQDHFILIQVANFHLYWGGIWVPPYLGHDQVVWKDARSTRRSTTFLIGALLFICFYNFGLFVLRRSDRASLVLSLFAFTIALRTLAFRLLANEYSLSDFFAFELPYKLIYITMVLSPTALIQFFCHVYPRQVSRKLPIALLLLASPYYLMVLAYPALVYAAYLEILKFVAMALVILIGYYLWKGYRAKEVGSSISLIGGGIFGISCILDILWTSGWTWLPSNSLSFGLLFFILAQSQIMALRFAKAFSRAGYLTVSLRDEVEQQTRDMTCILDSIQQGVFTIDDEDLTIGSVRSSYLANILPHAQTGQRHNLSTLLMEPMQVSNDKKSQVTSTVQSSIGADLFNFEVNAARLIHEAEFRLDGGSKSKLLELEWTPMVDMDEQVHKVLVCVRDVTEIKQLQEQTRQNREELQMIEELVNISEDRFHRFASRSREFIQSNLLLVQNHQDAYDRNRVDQLFINMHTIKGTARTYFLSSIAAMSHDIEQTYSELNKGQRAWQSEALTADLKQLDALVQRYELLGKEKLHWSLEDKKLKVSSRYLEQCLATAEGLLAEESRTSHSAHESLLELVQDFVELAATPLTAVLEDAAKGLDSLARDLGKDMPTIECSANDIYIRNAGDDLLHEVLVHILRNAVDHGIEGAAERTASGKAPRGLVRINVSRSSGNLQLDIEDDGRGLNLELIRQKAVKSRLIREQDALSPEEIAALIFHSGLSTKQEVSQVSGRGVGMDAVKSYLKRSGADIQLHLAPTLSAQTHVPFRFRLTLPSKFWCSGHHFEVSTLPHAV